MILGIFAVVIITEIIASCDCQSDVVFVHKSKYPLPGKLSNTNMLKNGMNLEFHLSHWKNKTL